MSNPTASSSALPAQNDQQKSAPEHLHRRFFIGPLPEKVITTTRAAIAKTKRKRSRPDEDENVARVIKSHALNFFVQAGGKIEDWGDDEETNVVEEMLTRWRHSEWGEILRSKKKDTGPNRWVGGSFEVGNLLGLNILQQESTNGLTSVTSRSSGKGLSSIYQPVVIPDSLAARDTFYTAPSRPHPPPIISVQSQPNPPTNSSLLTAPNNGNSTTSPSSSTPLLRLSTSQKGLRPSVASAASVRSEPTPQAAKKVRKRMVHYADSPSRSPRPSSRPASPHHVLEREGSDVEDTSAGAMMISPSSTFDVDWSDVILRGATHLVSWLTAPGLHCSKIVCSLGLVPQNLNPLVMISTRFRIVRQDICLMRIGANSW